MEISSPDFPKNTLLKLDQRKNCDRFWYHENIYYINKVPISNENICLAREHLVTPSKVSALAFHFKKGIHMEQI